MKWICTCVTIFIFVIACCQANPSDTKFISGRLFATTTAFFDNFFHRLSYFRDLPTVQNGI